MGRELWHFIDGERVAGTSGRAGDVFNPATGAQISEVSLAATDDVNTAVSLAKKHLTAGLRKLLFSERGYYSSLKN